MPNLLTSDRGELVAFQGLATVGNREEPRDGDVLRDWVWIFAPWVRVKDSCPDIDRQVRQVNRGALAGVLGLAPAQNPGTRVEASWSSYYNIHSTRLRRSNWISRILVKMGAPSRLVSRTSSLATVF